jgi:hypothetical protein
VDEEFGMLLLLILFRHRCSRVGRRMTATLASATAINSVSNEHQHYVPYHFVLMPVHSEGLETSTIQQIEHSTFCTDRWD